MAKSELNSWTIEDDLASAASGAIEVHVVMSSGETRWCFFMTPEALAACGDWVPGTSIRFHAGVSHMIVVSEISEFVIRSVLKEFEAAGTLLPHTCPMT